MTFYCIWARQKKNQHCDEQNVVVIIGFAATVLHWIALETVYLVDILACAIWYLVLASYGFYGKVSVNLPCSFISKQTKYIFVFHFAVHKIVNARRKAHWQEINVNNNKVVFKKSWYEFLYSVCFISKFKVIYFVHIQIQTEIYLRYIRVYTKRI